MPPFRLLVFFYKFSLPPFIDDKSATSAKYMEGCTTLTLVAMAAE